MQPIVDGLEAEYGDRIEFRKINAISEEGAVVYDFYGLRGHPAYLLLDPSGEVLWQGLGEQPKDNLVTPLEEAASQ